MYQQGDIVWLTYPYSDTTEVSRIRPAVLISNALNNDSDQDRIFVKITTNRRANLFSILLDENSTFLPLPRVSEIRANKLVTLHKDAIQSKITSLKPEVLEELITILNTIFE
jgi:mRNA-degrading endonuclease toxin of MazEF toxin-antitoxin module